VLHEQTTNRQRAGVHSNTVDWALCRGPTKVISSSDRLSQSWSVEQPGAQHFTPRGVIQIVLAHEGEGMPIGLEHIEYSRTALSRSR